MVAAAAATAVVAEARGAAVRDPNQGDFDSRTAKLHESKYQTTLHKTVKALHPTIVILPLRINS